MRERGFPTCKLQTVTVAEFKDGVVKRRRRTGHGRNTGGGSKWFYNERKGQISVKKNSSGPVKARGGEEEAIVMGTELSWQRPCVLVQPSAAAHSSHAINTQGTAGPSSLRGSLRPGRRLKACSRMRSFLDCAKERLPA